MCRATPITEKGGAERGVVVCLRENNFEICEHLNPLLSGYP